MDNIILINANSYHFYEKALKKIIGLNDNIVLMRYNNNMDEILGEASYFSLDNTIKIVIVKGADFFNKSGDDLDKLANYLDSYNDTTKLVFITSQVDSRLKVNKKIKESFTYIEEPKTDYKNIYSLISSYVEENGYKINYDVSKYLVSIYALNIDLICNELDKIMLFYNKPCTIKMDEAEKIITRVNDDNIFHFVDACVKKDFTKCLKLNKDLKVYKVDAFSLILMLAREYRLIYYVKKMFQMHLDLKTIMKDLALQDWQINKLYEESYNYSDNELLNIMKSLATYDQKLKVGAIDKDIAINCFLLDLFS